VRAAWLHRHDRFGLRCDGLCGAQELEDLCFVLKQLLAQLPRKRASGRIASQPVSIGGKPNVSAA
jgi:hypothetical protein